MFLLVCAPTPITRLLDFIEVFGYLLFRYPHTLFNQSSFPAQTMSTQPLSKSTQLRFHGSNWEDLNRLIALAKFQFLQDSDFADEEPKQCASLASCFDGPALDWVALCHANNARTFASFDGFVNATRQAFGVADTTIEALCRRKLDELSWGNDVPVFFAEFDRLTAALSITGHGTKVAMVEAKLPAHVKSLFADQALSFSNYDTMRERLNMMWALRPNKSERQQKPRCGSCGRKGHTTATCKGGSVSKN